MMNDILLLAAFVAFIAGVLFLTGWLHPHNSRATAAIAACEKELPRHLHCEAVITAEVVE